MPLPDCFCDKCIWNYVPKDTKLSDLKESEGTCDHCGNETKLYGLPWNKTVSDFLTVSLNVYATCVRCGERLKMLKDRNTETGIEIVVERHKCEDEDDAVRDYIQKLRIEREEKRFHHWCYLTEEGKKLYGTVFPDGKVPVVSMIPSTATIEGKEEGVYLIYHEEMTLEQVETMLELLAKKFESHKEEIRKEMLQNRIPLREKYTNGAGTAWGSSFE